MGRELPPPSPPPAPEAPYSYSTLAELDILRWECGGRVCVCGVLTISEIAGILDPSPPGNMVIPSASPQAHAVFRHNGYNRVRSV